jgi:hypothetical protein
MIENNNRGISQEVYKKELWQSIFTKKQIEGYRRRDGYDISEITETFYSYLDFNSFSNLRICSKEIYDDYGYFLTKQISMLPSIRMNKIQDFIRKYKLIDEGKNVCEILSMADNEAKIYLTIEDCKQIEDNSKFEFICKYHKRIDLEVARKIISFIDYENVLLSNKIFELFPIFKLYGVYPYFEINTEQETQLVKKFIQSIEGKNYEKIVHLFVLSLFLSCEKSE